MENGEDVVVARRGGSSRVNVNDILVLAPYDATNGFAYMLDDVLLPAWIEQTLFDIGSNSMSTFAYMLSVLGLENLLSRPSADLTVFAPNNDGFEAIDDAALAYILSPAGEDLLQELIRYHMVSGGPFPSMYFVPQPQTLSTLHTADSDNPSTITLSKRGQTWIVQGDYNEATLVEYDYVANNGLAHVIDTPLLFGPIPV